MIKKKQKKYYVSVCLGSDTVKISTSLQYAADFAGINRETVRRHLKKYGYYKKNNYLIFKDVGVETIKRGFAL